jgi:hypothetical protein
MALSIWLWVVIIASLYCLYHAGHGTANYRHARAAGCSRGVGLYWFGRGPWMTVPVPGTGFRIGHRL